MHIRAFATYFLLAYDYANANATANVIWHLNEETKIINTEDICAISILMPRTEKHKKQNTRARRHHCCQIDKIPTRVQAERIIHTHALGTLLNRRKILRYVYVPYKAPHMYICTEHNSYKKINNAIHSFTQQTTVTVVPKSVLSQINI